MRILLAAGCAFALATACSPGSGEAPAAQPSAGTSAPAGMPAPAPVQGKVEAVDPATMLIPPAVAADEDLMNGIRAGKSATLRTDVCAGPAAETTAALMAIVCKADYTVFWDAATLRWGAVGPNKPLIDQGAEQTVSAFMNPGPSPADQRIVVIWGLGFLIDAQNQALLADGRVIGHLVHTPALSTQLRKSQSSETGSSSAAPGPAPAGTAKPATPPGSGH